MINFQLIHLLSFFSKGSLLSSTPGSNKNYFNSILILGKIDLYIARRLSEWASIHEICIWF